MRAFDSVDTSRLVYGHIHVPFVRRLPQLMVVNSGAVSLTFDGDPRASSAIIDGNEVEIRRVAYDVEEEIDLLARSTDPLRASTIATLRAGRYVSIETAADNQQWTLALPMDYTAATCRAAAGWPA